MARTRYVKPDFFTDADLCELSPLHRLLFEGLWCHADREGRLEDKPKELKIKILPYDDCDIHAMLADLDGGGFIQRYEAGGVRCIHICKFREHQHPHVKELPSALPSPTARDNNGPGTSGASTGPAPGRPGANPPFTLMVNGDGEREPGENRAAEFFTLEEQVAEKKRRKTSEQEDFAKWFEEQRVAVLGSAWSVDKDLGIARIRRELDWVRNEADNLVTAAAHHFLSDPFRQKQDPPCSILWFARDRADYLSRAKREAAS